MIHETFPVTNQYVSVPPDLGHLNCAAYIAGVASGILDGANFSARVTAHTISSAEDSGDKTVFLIKFSPEVIHRETYV